MILLPLLAVAAFAIPYFFRDSPPPEDSDLIPSPAPDLAGEANGFDFAARAAADIYWPPEAPDGEPPLEEMAGGKAWNEDLAEDVLERNRSVLEQFDRSLSVPRFVTTPTRDPTLTLMGFRRLFYIASLRVWKRLAAGDSRDAMREALRVAHFGKRCEEAGGPAIQYMVGSALKGMARRHVDILLERAEWEPGDLKAAAGELEKLESSPGVVQASIRSEYAFISESIDASARGELPLIHSGASLWGHAKPILLWSSRLFFLPNHTKGLAGDMCREALQAIPLEGVWRRPDWPRFQRLAPHRWFPGRNGIGKHSIQSCASLFDSMIERYQSERLELSFTRLLLALRGYRSAAGRLPRSLEDLVPEWIRAIPGDPFKGQPLRYDSGRRLLYAEGNRGLPPETWLDDGPPEDPIDLGKPRRWIPFE